MKAKMFVNCWTVKPNAEIAQLGGIRIPLAFVRGTAAINACGGRW